MSLLGSMRDLLGDLPDDRGTCPPPAVPPLGAGDQLVDPDLLKISVAANPVQSEEK